jgi:hypothetical protein
VLCGGCGKTRWATMESIVKTKGCRSCVLSWVQTRVKPTPGWKERKSTSKSVVVPLMPLQLPMGNKAV